MTISKTVHSHDGFTLQAIAPDKYGREYLVHERYIGYTDREARQRFREKLKNFKAQEAE